MQSIVTDALAIFIPSRDIYIVVDLKLVSMVAEKSNSVNCVARGKARSESSHFDLFLERMHEFELGPEGESSHQKCNALRTFPRLFCV